jgi:hypothetical protein
MIDPNNAESSVSAGKRKAETVVAPCKVPRRSAAATSDSEGNESDGTASVEGEDSEDEEGPEQDSVDLEEYHSIQAMADADHAQVRPRPLSLRVLFIGLRRWLGLLAPTAQRTFAPCSLASRTGRIPRPGPWKMDPSARFACMSLVSLVIASDMSFPAITGARRRC